MELRTSVISIKVAIESFIVNLFTKINTELRRSRTKHGLKIIDNSNDLNELTRHVYILLTVR